METMPEPDQWKHDKMGGRRREEEGMRKQRGRTTKMKTGMQNRGHVWTRETPRDGERENRKRWKRERGGRREQGMS